MCDKQTKVEKMCLCGWKLTAKWVCDKGVKKDAQRVCFWMLSIVWAIWRPRAGLRVVVTISFVFPWSFAVAIVVSAKVGLAFGPAAPLTTTRSVRSIWHTQQLRVNVLFGLLQNFDQIASLLFVLVSEKSVGDSFVVTTSSSSNTMYVVLTAVRVIEIDDVLDIFDIWQGVKTKVRTNFGKQTTESEKKLKTCGTRTETATGIMWKGSERQDENRERKQLKTPVPRLHRLWLKCMTWKKSKGIACPAVDGFISWLCVH